MTFVFAFFLAMWPQLPSQLDAEATLLGVQRDQALVQIIPHAPQTSEILDALLIAPIALTFGGGGLDLAEGPMVGVHGASWTQMRYLWGSLDITDPAFAGRPLIDLPETSWQSLTLGDAWTTRPTLRFSSMPMAGPNPSFSAHIARSGPLGQAVLVPRHVFDRDPAFGFGAPHLRRGVRRRQEAGGRLSVPLLRGQLTLVAEHIDQRQRFLTLSGLESLERDTLTLSWQGRQSSWPLAWHAAWQRRSRQNQGAAWRLPESQTFPTQDTAALVAVDVSHRLAPDVVLRAGIGAGWAGAVSGPTPTPFIPPQDIADAAQALAPYSRPENTSRRFVGAHAVMGAGGPQRLHRQKLQHNQDPADLPPQMHPSDGAIGLWTPALNAQEPSLSLSARGRVSDWSREVDVSKGPRGLSWQGRPAVVEIIEGQGARHTGIATAHVSGNARFALSPQASLHMVLGLDGTRLIWAPQTPLAGVAPSAGAMGILNHRAWQFFLALRQDPEAITQQSSDFAAQMGPFGSTYAWEAQSSDAPPNASETGRILDRFGSRFYTVASHLQRPSHSRMTLGVHSPYFGAWAAGLRLTGHMLWHRYTVKRQGGPSSTTSSFADPGGDGRGEGPRGRGTRFLPVSSETSFRPDQSDMVFVLTNDTSVPHMLGLELELHSAPHRSWFVEVLGAAYLSRGRAPFGVGPFNNDPGIVSEMESRTNQRLMGRGRYDHDRAFALKILAGLRPRDGLSIALAARYRDGQPITRIAVDDTLMQGPTPLMAVARGKARATFRMSWDLRLRYRFLKSRSKTFTALVDVYNLWGSATELSEELTSGPQFRRAQEAVPGRSVWVGIEAALQPGA